ncbi:protein kinase [Stieleria sp. TO1_6]|uniref:bifunctional serine/threonine-protein kinase/formylglycine-generating enzyme family protein n=1 Tax=Stieleria tagensis TaxID=2956795 RepID=UPI00209AB818|nr:bifunctional serine/threonine-protein kinase/formylglycine-generating enzyme family protein [Stieleria tagensis]MCO8122333.1 protein kinase [Stieleria tagensis]
MNDPQNKTHQILSGSHSHAAASDETRELTLDQQGASDALEPQPIPDSIGRYQIESILGHGGYGAVYLAKDDELQRYVTVKVPHRRRIQTQLDISLFLVEARTLAKLEHPNIVPVHDVGHTLDGVCYIVSRYIDGCDLRVKVKSSTGSAPFSIGDATELITTLAEALHYVHSCGVVHRDIKPSNILLDQRGVPYLADFGLALLENDAAKSRMVVGTPAYMSPEQARGENHLVRGTSDIFSLGIVLYELVGGQRVFPGSDPHAVLELVQHQEVRSLRDINRDVPAELDRICMKAISKRASDRHQTAIDFADDLKHFLAQNRGLQVTAGPNATVHSPLSSSESGSLSANVRPNVIPRGLRSFGDEDAGFYLELLPAPYDRDGIPESVLFWKRRIEQLDPADSFRVGLIYGPSGCGKSSFVRAGVIPILSSNIIPVLVEAAPDATENRLLNRLRRCCPYLSTDLGLRESVASFRHGQLMGSGKKVLIVIDQFEQWLYSVDQPEHSELANALRQCDGEHVQCILLVRDDFWLALSRFMDHLEVELRQGQNMTLVDLFDTSHAKGVLTAFGRAFGQLPARASEMSREQRGFISQAVDDLSENGKVVPVRLALFAEMFKGKPWTSSTLKKIGGTEGVGVKFLNENFSSDNAPADYRVHQKAAYAILVALLPQPGADLKGHMKSRDELLEASGYSDRPKMFQSLIRTLDSELHLITRTDPEGHGDDATASYSGDLLSKHSYYQLAHDYLVPAIRKWQSQMQHSTRQGRAEIRLTERSEIWKARPDTRHLPSVSEWASISALTRHADWDDGETRMMKAATRRYSKSCLITLFLVAALALTSYQFLHWNRAVAYADQLSTAGVGQVPALLDQMQGYERWTIPRLNEIQQQHTPGSPPHLFAGLALLRAGQGRVQDIQPYLLTADPDRLSLLCDELRPYRSQITADLWRRLRDESPADDMDPDGRPSNSRFNAALALASFEPPAAGAAADDWEDRAVTNPSRWSAHQDFIADRLIHFAIVDRQFYPTLVKLIAPLTPVVSRRLSEAMVDLDETESRRETAQTLLMDLFRDNPVELTDHFLIASPAQLEPSLKLIDNNQAMIRPLLDRVVCQPLSIDAPNWERTAVRQATAAALLLRHHASNESIWSVFRHHGLSDARTQLIQRVSPLQVDADMIAQRLQGESDALAQCGLIQALGEYTPDQLSDDLRDRTLTLVKGWFIRAPQASLRSNSLWLLRRWGMSDWIQPQLWEAVAPSNERDWYVDARGNTMVQLPARSSDDHYRIEACISETTVAQMLQFDPDYHWSPKHSPSQDCAVTMPTFHQAAAYCNSLTRELGLGESQVCYPDRTDDAAPAVQLYPDYRSRTGYRLPTSDEWFYIRDIGVQTKYPFGNNKDLVTGYAIFNDTEGFEGERCWPLGTSKPNDKGFFDLITGTREWVSDVDPDKPNRRGLCGNSFVYDHFRNYGEVKPESLSFDVPNLAHSYIGFRVVRSIPIELASAD